MMRYQRVNPDCLPLSNGRKSSLRTCKEEDSESGKITHWDGKALKFSSPEDSESEKTTNWNGKPLKFSRPGSAEESESGKAAPWDGKSAKSSRPGSIEDPETGKTGGWDGKTLKFSRPDDSESEKTTNWNGKTSKLGRLGSTEDPEGGKMPPWDGKPSKVSRPGSAEDPESGKTPAWDAKASKFNRPGLLEDFAEAGKIPTWDGKTAKFTRLGSTSSATQDHNQSQFFSSESPQPENHTSVKTQNNPENGSASGSGGDFPFQWVHKKRSRVLRADNRAATDESSAQAKQMAKIDRRLSSSIEKKAMASPLMASPGPFYNRTINHRSSMPAREAAGSLHGRNSEDRAASGNGSQLGNGHSSRIHPRSAEKRSPQSPEKMEKITSSSMAPGNGTKTKGAPAAQAEAVNGEPAPQPEPEASAPAEKLNLDLFEWPRIYVALSRKEKEDDFLAMKGTKLPQRPKKRAKNVDKTLQYCFPGMWLSDLTRSRYEVREKKCVKKRRRGLKGMESMESDSE